MRWAGWLICGLLVMAAQVKAVQEPGREQPGTAPPATTLELIEDLRILAIVNVLQPTRAQCNRLAAAADTARKELAAVEADARAKLEQQRDRLLAARQTALRGGTTPRATDQLLGSAGQAVSTLRGQRIETLIRSLTNQVRTILTSEQAARVENDLAPTIEQPWRHYAGLLGGSAAAGRTRARLPSDPGKWLHELRDLRIDSAEGDPAHEIEDFGKKMSRGLRAGTPLFQETVAWGRNVATQVLAMPSDTFTRRELDLARLVARQDLTARNAQRVQEGKAPETFDPYRWLVEEVLLSPRAVPNLRDRAAAR